MDILLVSCSLSSDEDLYNLLHAARQAKRVVAIGTCAISGGMAHLSDRDEVRRLFLTQRERYHLLPKSRPIDFGVAVDCYLPGCPPTPELLITGLFETPGFKVTTSVCLECGRRKVKEMRPKHLVGFLKGEV